MTTVVVLPYIEALLAPDMSMPTVGLGVGYSSTPTNTWLIYQANQPHLTPGKSLNPLFHPFVQVSAVQYCCSYKRTQVTINWSRGINM